MRRCGRRTDREEERLHPGLLQTLQSFYDPDAFRRALYAEKRAPSERDFLYPTASPPKPPPPR